MEASLLQGTAAPAAVVEEGDLGSGVAPGPEAGLPDADRVSPAAEGAFPPQLAGTEQGGDRCPDVVPVSRRLCRFQPVPAAEPIVIPVVPVIAEGRPLSRQIHVGHEEYILNGGFVDELERAVRALRAPAPSFRVWVACLE